jgi:hypothetical protein
MSLMKDYLSQGYSLYIDNFYTSPTLVNDLYGFGVHATGTLDCSRIGVPSKISQLKKEFGRKSVCRGSGAYIRDGTSVYAVWKDTKCVSVMSNEHPGHSEGVVLRNVKCEGENEKKEVPIPVIVQNYNRYMNGVDKSDQLIKYYNVLRQTHKYWKTLFLHYIDIAIVNSYIIYKEIYPNKLTHFAFRETLVRQLCCFEVGIQQSVSGKIGVSTTTEHLPERLDKVKSCVYCRINLGIRSQTTRQCSTCEAPLCIYARNCYELFHLESFKSERMKWINSKTTPKATPAAVGRPKGTTVQKGKGKRKKRNW